MSSATSPTAITANMHSTSTPITHHQAQLSSTLRIHYLLSEPPDHQTPTATLLLIHGFPQTSYQYRLVLPLLASAGYRCIAPDYRGAGSSSRPASGYSKRTIAADLHTLLTSELSITTPIVLIGHDIGGMIAHAYVSQYPSTVATVIWGECPLPGSTEYESTKHGLGQWHFQFHAVGDIAEELVKGKERIYLQHFFSKLSQNPLLFEGEVLNHYVGAYSQPGALRAAFATYAAFEGDATDNRSWRATKGKVPVRSMVLSGEKSLHAKGAMSMAMEFYQNPDWDIVKGAGHYIAEENPADFVAKVRACLGDF